MLDDEIDGALLIRYVAGDASADERLIVERWIGDDMARVRIVTRLRDDWVRTRGVRLLSGAIDTPSAWHRVRSRIATREVERPLITRPMAAWRIAATIIALLGVAGLVARSVRGRAHEYAAQAGHTMMIELSDGTRCQLAPASRLIVAAAYAHGVREVTLDGEAYFTVVHDGAHPFTVRAGRATVTDVGTRFDVRAYPGDSAIRVAVADGAVAVASGRSPIRATLGASEVAEVHRNAGITTGRTDVATLTAWTTGELRFRAATLSEVSVALGRWYDLDVRVADPVLNDRLITLSMRGYSMDRALSAIAFLAHARVERHGRSVTFTSFPLDR